MEAAGFSRHLPLAATGSIDGKLIIWDCGTFSERGVCMHDDVSGFGYFYTATACLGDASSNVGNTLHLKTGVGGGGEEAG